MPTGKGGSRGFTLLELMIAMSLFMVLGTALIALVSRAMDFLDTGTGGAELQDKSGEFLRSFQTDIGNVVVERGTQQGKPSIRFLADFVPIDSDGDGEVDYQALRLAFVRSSNEEISDPHLRLGGTKPGAREYYDGRDVKAKAAAGALKPLGGLLEVLYMAVPTDPAQPGLLTVWRGVRAPVGGPGSLLDRDTVRSVEDLMKVAEPVMPGVLHFGVLFWSSDTTSWETEMAGFGGGAPLRCWDSTRGVLPAGSGLNEFPLARGEASLVDPRDDISPRQIRVTFVVDRTGVDAEAGYLAGGIDDRAGSVPVAPNTAFALTSTEEMVKVGSEWMVYSSRTDDAFTIRKRGAWNTMARTHKSGTPVRAGFAVSRTIQIPCYREEYPRPQ